MYILIIARGYPNEKYKMNGLFEFDQAKALAGAGHKIVFAAVDLRSIRRLRKWGFESFNKEQVFIEAINVPCGPVPKAIKNATGKFALQRLYKRVLAKHGQPDIIHAHFIHSGYLAVQVFNDSKIPLILTEHYSGMNNTHIDPYLAKIGGYTYPRVNKLIAVSNFFANNIREKFQIRTTVIPNIVDTANFRYIPSNNNDSFDFISTGRLVPNKRMDLLIESFYIAFGHNKGIKLYIYGDGPERTKLEKYIAALNMEEQIFLMGLVERKVLAEKMTYSDCFILLSRLETFGVAYIEALACGLPVIATKCGGPEDFIKLDNGVLVSDEKNALAAAMQDMIDNAHKYDKVKISTEAREKFSPKAITNLLTMEYQKSLAKQIEDK